MRFSILVMSVAGLLAGCVVEPGRPPHMPPDHVQGCGAKGLQELVGRPARVLQTMRFGVPVRIIRPGTAITMDYSAGRLNIEINRNERIVRVYCG